MIVAIAAAGPSEARVSSKFLHTALATGRILVGWAYSARTLPLVGLPVFPPAPRAREPFWYAGRSP